MDSHMSVPTTSVSQVTGVENLTCFEILHIKEMENLRNRWELNGNPMGRVYKTQNFYKYFGQISKSQIPRRSAKVKKFKYNSRTEKFTQVRSLWATKT